MGLHEVRSVNLDGGLGHESDVLEDLRENWCQIFAILSQFDTDAVLLLSGGILGHRDFEGDLVLEIQEASFEPLVLLGDLEFPWVLGVLEAHKDEVESFLDVFFAWLHKSSDFLLFVFAAWAFDLDLPVEDASDAV